MERSIRQTKRQLNMKQSELDLLPQGSLEHDTAQAEYDRLAYKLRQKNMKYGEFCADHNLTQQADRVKVAGWNAAESRKANGRARAYINAKISTKRASIGNASIKVKSESEPKVKELKEVTLDGVTYKVDNKNVLINATEHERNIAQILADHMQKNVKLVPIIEKPEGISTPDYLIKGEKYDLKDINGESKNALYNAVHKKKRQANNFVFDVTNSKLTEENIKEQVAYLRRSEHTQFVKDIVIIKDGKVLDI